MSGLKRRKSYLRYAVLLPLLVEIALLSACYRVDVPSFGDAALRKAANQVIEVNDSKQEKIPLSLRVSPNELSRRTEQTESKGAWEMWPTALSVPVKFDIDMAAFNQRALSDKPLTDAVVIIDPSHGSTVDLGAVGEYNGGSVSERQVTISLANKLKTALENMGATVHLLREADEWRSLHYRVAEAGDIAVSTVKPLISAAQLETGFLETIENGIKEMKERNNDRQDLPAQSSGLGMAWGYGVGKEMRKLLDLEGQLSHFVLISLNMGSASQLSNAAAGFEAYYLDSNYIFERELESMGNRPDSNGVFAFASNERANPAYTYRTDAQRARLANAVYDAVVSKITQFSKNSKKSEQVGTANFTSLRESGYASCALQCGFISNASDLAWMMDEENQGKLAQAISEGIYSYYCLSNWSAIEGLSRISDSNWKRAGDAYREKISKQENENNEVNTEAETTTVAEASTESDSSVQS